MPSKCATRVTGAWSIIPLAGPANRQGRIAADNIFGRPSRYEGTWGTAFCGCSISPPAARARTRKSLRKANIPFQALHLHPGSHAGYYPGAEPIAMKILFAPDTGKLLGAQAVGHEGVDKRIDVFATALKGGMTVHDLAELELAYAPPFGSAKDPVNLAGMAAQNVLAGDVQLAQWNEIASLDPQQTAPARRSPPRRTRERFHPRLDSHSAGRSSCPHERTAASREIIVYCQSGQRSYFACRILAQHGFRVRNLTGSFRTWKTALPGDK